MANKMNAYYIMTILVISCGSIPKGRLPVQSPIYPFPSERNRQTLQETDQP